MKNRQLYSGILAGLALSGAAFASDPAWPKLLRLVRHERKNADVRVTAMALACQSADANGAAQLVGLTSGWMVDIDSRLLTQADIQQDAALRNRYRLIRTMVLEGRSRLNEVAADRTEMLAFWAY